LLLGAMAAVASWTEIRERPGFFYFNLLWNVAGVIGVFLALDLFLFFVFWEAMLVPMYFLIALWGHEDRLRAAIKFFIFTQASGLLMLTAIIALALVHHAQVGHYSFDYLDLLGQQMGSTAAFWIMLGFFIAFTVKLPAFPFHSWLPDAHTEAPTGGSVLLAGILLKTGAYGLLRFAIPLFPGAAAQFAPVAMGLGVIGIAYGAVVAFAQSDIKRLVAYTSISHMGFVLLGAYTMEALALRGTVMEMLAHGISTGALFMIAGALQERLGTREMARMGGLWQTVPRIGALGLFFVIASFGLPGLANFVGEFLVLFGAFGTAPVFAVLAASALVLSAAYGLILVQCTFHGPGEERALRDFGAREMATMGVMIVLLVWLGLFPQPLFDATGPVLNGLTTLTTTTAG
jgi:NADH-quinone oxidoreductase subunit M